MQLVFYIDRQTIKRADKNVVVSGSKNYVTAKFIDINKDWKNPITAIFGAYTQILDENGECEVPWVVLKNPGSFSVSAFCGDLITANKVIVPVLESGYIEGQTPTPPTQDVYSQLVSMVQNAIDTADSVRDDADAGKFDGEQGPQGPQGEPGKDAPQINDNTISTENPWSSMKIVDTLCPPFTVTGNPAVCNPIENFPLSVSVEIVPKQDGSGNPTPENIRPISGWDAVQLTQNGSPITIQLGQTVYGGSINVVTGVCNSAWVIVELTSEFLDTNRWQFITTGIQTSPVIRGPLPSANTVVGPVFCSHFYAASILPVENLQYWTSNTFFGNGRMAIRNDTWTDLDSAKAWLDAQKSAGTPVFVCYQIETPTTIQLSPQAILALSGENTFSADTGSVTVSGRSDPTVVIESITQRISALEQNAIGG